MSWQQAVGVVGAGLAVVGALLLVVVITPGRKRYEGMTGAHLEYSPPMLLYMKHQSWAGAIVLVGATMQFVSAIFSTC
jgi:1-acyl-sn-glycerol-3-phosphate acyltransferase